MATYAGVVCVAVIKVNYSGHSPRSLPEMFFFFVSAGRCQRGPWLCVIAMDTKQADSRWRRRADVTSSACSRTSPRTRTGPRCSSRCTRVAGPGRCTASCRCSSSDTCSGRRPCRHSTVLSSGRTRRRRILVTMAERTQLMNVFCAMLQRGALMYHVCPNW